MKKFITLMLIAFVATFGFVSCTDYHVTIDNLPGTEDMTADEAKTLKLFNEYVKDFEWSTVNSAVARIIINGTNPSNSASLVTAPITPVFDDTIVNEDETKTYPITVTVPLNLKNFAYGTDKLANGTLTLTYTGTAASDDTFTNTLTINKVTVESVGSVGMTDEANITDEEAINVTFVGVSNIIQSEKNGSFTIEVKNGSVDSVKGISTSDVVFQNSSTITVGSYSYVTFEDYVNAVTDATTV